MNETRIFLKKPSLLNFRRFDDLTYLELSGTPTDGVPQQDGDTITIADADSTSVVIPGIPFSGEPSAWITSPLATLTYRVRLRVESNGLGVRFRMGYGPYTDYQYQTDGIIQVDVQSGVDLGDQHPDLGIYFEDGWTGTLHWIEVFDIPAGGGSTYEDCQGFTNYDFRNGSQLDMDPTGQTGTLVIDANLTLNGRYLGVDVYNLPDFSTPVQGESYRVEMTFTPASGQPALTRDIELYLGYGTAIGSPVMIPAGTTTFSETLVWTGGESGTGSVGAPFFMRTVFGQTAEWVGTITMSISRCVGVIGGPSHYYELETSDDEAFPLTYSIGDIREPEKRNGSFSKTITLPGTKLNAKTLAFLYEIESEGHYDVRRKVECLVVQSGSIVFEGSMQLLRINREQDGLRDYNKVTYDVSLINSFVDLFSTVGEKLLTDLDLGKYDHEFSIENALRTGYVHDDIPANEFVKKDGADYLNWVLGTAFVSDRIRPLDVDGTGMRVSIKTDADHDYVEGDQLFIMSTTQIKKMRVGGYQVVYSVVSSTEFVITMGWGSIVDTLLTAGVTGDYYNTDEFQGLKMTPTGEGYCYPQIDNGLGDSVAGDGTFDVYRPQLLGNMAPATYVKTIVDQIFKEAGYSYSSTFLETPFFKRLIVPSVETLKKSDELQYDMSCRVALSALAAYSHPSCTGNTWSQNGSTATFGIGELLPFNDDSTGTNFDNGSNWNTTTYRYTMPVTSGLNVRVKGSVYHCKASSGEPNPFSVGTELLFIIYNASNVEQVRKIVPVLPALATTATGGAANAIPFDVTVGAQNWGSSFDGAIEAGWYVVVRLRAQGNTNGGANLLYGVTADTRVECWPDVNIYSGNAISLSASLPPKVKQKELLVDVIRMFNLYLQPRKENPRIIDIEPREDFYNFDSPVDWTYKADLSKPVVITPLGDLAAKSFLYTYKSDSDSLNKRHTEGFKEVYGQQREDVFNDFTKGEKKIELTASATPIAGPTLYYTPDVEDSLWDRHYSCIVKNQPTAQGVPGGSISGNYRILYWAPRTSHHIQGWYPVSQSGSATADLYVYGYAGHLDHVFGPTCDLNFGFPREVYYSYTTWTDNNLFNRFHREELLDRSSQRSRVITAHFQLKPSDIGSLDFRRGVVFDGHLCRLNKVQDYQAIGKGESTLVELVTIAEARTRFTSSSPVGTGVGVTGADISRVAYDSAPRALASGSTMRIGGGLTDVVLVGVDDFYGAADDAVIIGDAPTDEVSSEVRIKKSKITLEGATKMGVLGQPVNQAMYGKIRITKDTTTTLDTSSPGTPLILAGEGFTSTATLTAGHSVKVRVDFDEALEGAASDGSNVVVMLTLVTQPGTIDDSSDLDTNLGVISRLCIGVLQTTDTGFIAGITYDLASNSWSGDVEFNFVAYAIQ